MIYHLIGVGHVAENIIKKSLTKNFFLYDNNPDLQGTNFLGFNIEPLTSLIKQTDGEIIICTTSIGEIRSHLEHLGISLPLIIPPELEFFSNQSHLLDLNNKFLVASGLPSNNLYGATGGLFLISESNGTVETEQLISGPCHSVIRDSENFVVSVQSEGLVILDGYFNRINSINLPIGARPHGVSVTDDSYYVVASNFDSLLCVNKKTGLIDEINFSDKRKTRLSAQHHANDIEIIDGYAYVSMFSVSGSWKHGLFDGGLLEINLANGKVSSIPLSLKLPHSVRSIDNSLVVLNSFDGVFFSFGCFENYKFNGFLRGLDYDEKFIYLAESRNRNSTPLLKIHTPISIDSKINTICRKSHLSKTLILPRNISEIHSILKLVI